MTLEATLDAIVDDAVEFVFHVVNTGTNPVEVTFRTGQDADIAVYDADTADLVWRWSDDKLFTQAIERTSLDPGQTTEYSYTWEHPSPGQYTAVASLAADANVEARTIFTV